ncbi:MAG: ABC transporter ATP-binding protein/permease [Acholeplasmataceae bacterium]|nr:ABC transporter ATP-binding protein/permease [Acholeplasmataceae bacterium]
MIFGKHINKYYLKYSIPLILGVISLLVVDYYQIQIPKILGILLDDLKKGTVGSQGLSEFIGTFSLIVGIMVIGRIAWRLLVMGTSRRVEYDLREQLYVHSLKLDQPYYQTHKVGALMAYFSNDLDAVRMSFGRGTLLLFDSLFLGVLVIIRMVDMNWQLTLVSTIPLLFLGITAFFIIKKMRIKFKLRQDAFEHMSDFTQESFSGIQVIKAFVKEVTEAFRFKEINDDFYNKHMDFVKTMIWVNIVINVFISLTMMTIIGVGAFIAINGGLTTGQLFEFYALFGTLIWPVMALTQYANFRSQAQASYKRVSEFLESKPILKEGNLVLENMTGSVTFKNLNFSYPDAPDIPVLKNINLKIKAGESIGILGRTGSGKSTFVDLLLRVYNVEAETVYLDDYDMMDLTVKSTRDHIAYVPQDNFLYSTTIKDNIGFSEQEMSIDKIHEAAKLSDVYDNIVEFKEGFETVLGERGVTVSGGQKQRISIARALAKDAPILILDDSVSAVDTNTEETILNNLKQIRKGKTTIVIAHRISTVRKLDRIVLLDKGFLVDVGTHQELMNRSPLYQDMVERQTLESQVTGNA